MSRRRPAPPPSRGALGLTSSLPLPWQQPASFGASFPYDINESDDEPPNSARRDKAKTTTRCCKHCGLSRTGHSTSGCPNVYPPIPPKWFEKIWENLVMPTVQRNARLARGLERLNALQRDRPADVYVMLVTARQLPLEMDMARSLKYAVGCLYPGDSWPDDGSGLLIVGWKADKVKSVRSDLLRHGVSPDTWEDVVVNALKMDKEIFWGVTTALKDEE